MKDSIVLELIGKGVFITRLVTIVLLGIAGYMWVSGIELDETLRACLLIVIGFFFSNELTKGIIENLLHRNEILEEEVRKLTSKKS